MSARGFATWYRDGDADHLVLAYAIAGLFSGFAGIATIARAESGQAGTGVGYELDAIAAMVIGTTSLTGGIGRITGTVIGTIILGVMTCGFTFLRIDAHLRKNRQGRHIRRRIRRRSIWPGSQRSW